MDFPAPELSPIVGYGFIALAALLIAAILAGVYRLSHSRSAVVFSASVLIGWPLLSLLAARAGLLSRFDAKPPPGALYILLTFAIAIAVAWSRVGTLLATSTSWAALVAVHAFRLPLELLMKRAADEGIMPRQMSFGGYNFDVVSGVLAIVVAGLLWSGRANRKWVVLFQVVGSVLLAVILVVGLLSTPVFRAFGSDPSVVNTWMFHPPYVLLPSVFVFVAFTGHLLLFRALALRSARS